jgi:predicted Rossmann fold flavoprotein
METSRVWDVIVVGGGPAGMMAAGRAAERGARVLLLEKNESLGKKLLITGGGRCNVTNAEPDLRTLLSHYTEAGKFLFSPFTQFDNHATRAWFEKHGMPTKVEDNQRVFPTSNQAASVLEVLRAFLDANHVTVRTFAAVDSISSTEHHITSISLKDRSVHRAHSYIIATGGTSRPDTGSTGDGFSWLAAFGHTIHTPDPSLVPITLQDAWVPGLSGLTLPDVKLTVWQSGERQRTQSGKLLFTHFGISGPTVLHLSKTVGELLIYGPVTITIDCFPTLDHGSVDELLHTLVSTHANKQIDNALGECIPHALALVVLKELTISPDTKCHSLTRENRRRIMHYLKQLPLQVRGRLGVEKAIVTSGGVPLTEIHTKTMQSRRIDNLYLIGDILNIDRPSGGYSLQLCWTTGYVAGSSVPFQT